MLSNSRSIESHEHMLNSEMNWEFKFKLSERFYLDMERNYMQSACHAIYPPFHFTRIIFRECIFCCGQWPVGASVLLHTIPGNKRGRGVNGPARRLAHSPILSSVLAANIEYFCSVLKLGTARVTTNQWSMMYDCLLPHYFAYVCIPPYVKLWRTLIIINIRCFYVPHANDSCSICIVTFCFRLHFDFLSALQVGI